MSDLEGRPVDPRDTCWEVWDPAYRVYFWRLLDDGGWASREFEVPNADVTLVLDWADQHANDGETYTLFVVVSRGEDRGMVRLAGDDPTRG